MILYTYILSFENITDYNDLNDKDQLGDGVNY